MTAANAAIALAQQDFLTLESLGIEAPPPDDRQRLLRFPLSTQDSGLLRLEDIAEVLPVAVDSILPVPGIPDAVLGLCNWRGDMLWLVDFSTLTGYPPLLDQAISLTSLIVLVIKAQGQTVGLGVPQFDDVELHDLNHLQPVSPGLFSSKLYPFIAGVLPGDQGVVINAPSIIQCPLWHSTQEDPS
ncbi:MAG: chemotaxis protein CheW [Elainellaceae cyanobacterium]